MAAAVDAIEANPSIQMVELRDLVGMTTKRLTALFRTEIGFSPKAYARIRRLQAATVARVDERGAGRGRGRLFRPGSFRPGIPFLCGMTPTQYTEQRLVLPSHVPVMQRHKYPIPLATAPS
ncbi:MAG: hypothetical protein QOG14_948 [Mycobacterium sp.]|nr:hypothetical protein [Mycobacterium sp.]